MKIAIVTAVLGSAGGMGRAVEEQARRLAARDHLVTVFTPARAQGVAPMIPGVRVEWLHPRFQYGHGAWVPQLAKMLDGFDVVHLHYPFLGGVGAVLKFRNSEIPKFRNTKLVVTYHMDLLGAGLFRIFFRLYQHVAVPQLVRASDRLIVSSLDYARASDLAPCIKKLGDRLVEIPFGVDTDRFAPQQSDQALRNELGIASGESVVLFVGRLDRAHYFKGVAILLRAFATFAEYAKNTRLVLVGSGALVPTWMALAKKLRLDARVVFASAVSEKDLPRYYSLADVLVLPSVDRSEAFGLVLLEAQASGVPVIATDLPGVRTTFQDQKTGLIVPCRDVRALAKAMIWLLAHPEERLAMSRAARARMEENYQWDQVIDRLLEAYQ